jgi:hypothetical protein
MNERELLSALDFLVSMSSALQTCVEGMNSEEEDAPPTQASLRFLADQYHHIGQQYYRLSTTPRSPVAQRRPKTSNVTHLRQRWSGVS